MRRLLGSLLLCLPLSALATEPLTLDAGNETPASPWHVSGLPQQSKPFTRFSIVSTEGHRVLKVEADRSYGNLVHPLAPGHAGTLSWRWRVEQPLASSDLRHRTGDDSEIRVCVFFDEPMERLSFGERALLRFARSRAADPVPTATLCYVWDTRLPVGTLIDNAFTRRLRYIVVESGSPAGDRWFAERRDLREDFARAFGDECDTVPPVIGIAVGADADNTGGHSVAYVGDLSLDP